MQMILKSEKMVTVVPKSLAIALWGDRIPYQMLFQFGLFFLMQFNLLTIKNGFIAVAFRIDIAKT